MNNYAGPATLVLADGSRAPGAVNLRLDPAGSGRPPSWSGRFRADNSSANVFNAVGGNLPLELPNGQTGQVLVQSLDNAVSSTHTLQLLGNGAPPF